MVELTVDVVFGERLPQRLVVVAQEVPQQPRTCLAELTVDAMVVFAESEQQLAVIAAAGAARDRSLLEHRDADAGAREVQRGRDAGDAAADYEHVRRRGQRSARSKRRRLLKPQRGHGRASAAASSFSRIMIFCQIFRLRPVVRSSMSSTAATACASGKSCT